jgi:hypothetical protein
MLRRDALADLSGSIRTMPECLKRSKYFYGLIGLISFCRIQRATIVYLFIITHESLLLSRSLVTDRDYRLMYASLLSAEPLRTVTITLFA